MTYCCSVFPKIAKRFEWLEQKETEIGDCYHTPHIMPENHIMLLKFCPHCGKDIRGIVITKAEFDKLKYDEKD